MRWSVVSGLLLTAGAGIEYGIARVADPLILAAGLGAAAALVARARWPLAAGLTSLTLFALPALLFGRQLPALGDGGISLSLTAAWLLAVFTAGRACEPGRAAVAGLPVAAVCLLYAVGPGAPATSSGNDLLAATLFSGALPWLAGLAVNRHRAASRAKALAAQARADAVDERVRIAREVHDVVSRSVTAMVVQAEACEAVLAVAPERSVAFLHGLQQSGRDALGEMQQTVRALRSGRRHDAGLDGLPALLDATRRAGLPVDVELEAPDRRVPPEVEECAYRIIREALTNVLRHSDGAGAAVRIAYRPDRLEVSIVDRGRPVRRSLPGGLGLVGLREAVAEQHGTLAAGHGAHGQYVVQASLPIP